jgi:hypothetical protein
MNPEFFVSLRIGSAGVDAITDEYLQWALGKGRFTRQAAQEALSAWAGSPGQPATVRAVEIPALQKRVPRSRLGL